VNAVIRRRLTETDPPPRKSDVQWIAATLLDGLVTRREAS